MMIRIKNEVGQNNSLIQPFNSLCLIHYIHLSICQLNFTFQSNEVSNKYKNHYHLSRFTLPLGPHYFPIPHSIDLWKVGSYFPDPNTSPHCTGNHNCCTTDRLWSSSALLQQCCKTNHSRKLLCTPDRVLAYMPKMQSRRRPP